MPVLDAYNYSLLSVPAVWLLGISTHWTAIFLSAKSKEIPMFDNVAPRQCLAEIQKLAKTSKVRAELYSRAAAPSAHASLDPTRALHRLATKSS